MKVKPRLEIIQIGEDLASTTYIQKKKQLGEKIGIEVILHKLQENQINEAEVVIQNLQKNISGLIFQLPVPLQFNRLVDETPDFADVDLLGETKTKLLFKGLLPPTIAAIDLVLKEILYPKENSVEKLLEQKLDLSGKIVGVIGQGKLVGGPMVEYLLQTGATIVSLNKKTPDKKSFTNQCDILITGAGSSGLIDESWLKPGTIVIDAATSESDGQLVGDLKENINDKNYLLVKSPGGIGPITVLFLFYNLIRLKEIFN